VTEQPPPPPPGSEPGSTPRSDAPDALHIDGILDGRVLDEATLHRAVEQLSTAGAGAFRIDISGGRFSVLPAATQVAAGGFDAAAQTTFLDRLQDVADAAQPGTVETNLRCKLVYNDEVAETLFVMRGHNLEPVTRRRPVTAQDRGPLTSTTTGVAGLSRKQMLWLAPLFLVASLALMWQAGWLERATATPAAEVLTNTGPFGDMLAVDLTSSWGIYHVTLARGEGYPTTPAALDARRAASETLAARAACDVVGKGDDLFVQLLQEDGTALFQTRCELRPLLTDTAATIETRVPGHSAAHRVNLSLTPAK